MIGKWKRGETFLYVLTAVPGESSKRFKSRRFGVPLGTKHKTTTVLFNIACLFIIIIINMKFAALCFSLVAFSASAADDRVRRVIGSYSLIRRVSSFCVTSVIPTATT